jgi:flagellar hook-length control protein FliK
MNPAYSKTAEADSGSPDAAFAPFLSRLRETPPSNERLPLRDGEGQAPAEAESNDAKTEAPAAQTSDQEQPVDANVRQPSSGTQAADEPSVASVQPAAAAQIGNESSVAPSQPAAAVQTGNESSTAPSQPAAAVQTGNASIAAPLPPAAAVQKEEPQAQGSAQALPVVADDGEKTADEGKKAETRISAALAEAGGEEDGPAPDVELPEAESVRAGKDVKAGRHGQEDENAPQKPVASKEGSGAQQPQQRGAALSNPNDGEGRSSQTLPPARSDASNGAGNPAPSQALPQGGDGAAPGQQNMTATAAIDHAARGMDKAEVHPLSRLQAAHSAEPVDHTFSIVRHGNHLAVQIEPGGLGKIDINLSLEQGLVNARIHVADPATRNLIENNMQQILDALLKEGVSVGGLSVALKQNGARDGANSGERGDSPDSSEAAPQAMSGAASPAPRGRVNIFV